MYTCIIIIYTLLYSIDYLLSFILFSILSIVSSLFKNALAVIFHVYRISSKRRRGYYLFQLYCNAATIRGRLLFEVQTSRILFISALPQCGDYLTAATIRGAAFIRGNTVYTLMTFMHTDEVIMVIVIIAHLSIFNSTLCM